MRRALGQPLLGARSDGSCASRKDNLRWTFSVDRYIKPAAQFASLDTDSLRMNYRAPTRASVFFVNSDLSAPCGLFVGCIIAISAFKMDQLMKLQMLLFMEMSIT